MRFLTFFLLSLCALASAAFGQATMRPNDNFEMMLNGVPAEFAQDFRGMYTVGEDGTISVPLIGSIKAAGLTSTQLQRAIERKLVENKMFTGPTVLINLQAQTRFVTVGGGVRVPQAVPWSADLTLSAALKRAGGASDFGNIAKTRVTRDGKMAVFNLKTAGKDPNQNPKLLPGDEVEVPE